MLSPVKMSTLEFVCENFSIGGSPSVEYLTEATFRNGKEKVSSLVPLIKNCKDVLEEMVAEVDDSYKAAKGSKNVKRKSFNSEKYWKHKCWRDLEDEISKLFGFRDCEIAPWQEKYYAGDKTFESMEMNAYVSRADRFPIDGLITDDGYYDKTHSSRMFVAFSLGLIRALEPEEILAALLHEFGHSIDPALTTITYEGTEDLVKYITDRKGKKEGSGKKNFGILILILLFGPSIYNGIKDVFIWFRNLIMGKKWVEEQKLKKVIDALEKDKLKFDRQTFSEAFADNFARMYGYAVPLATAFKKMSKDFDDRMAKWYKKDQKRQEAIVRMTLSAIKDEHKTDVHRIMALIKEYEEDLKDPNLPEPIKKAMQDDVDGLKKVLDGYMNDFYEFQNKVNKAIKESIEAKADTASK